MWTTLLVLAMALNFEPTRLGVIALLLIRPRPIPQLLAFLAGSFLTSASAGLAVLLVLHRGIPSETRFDGARVQIAVGIIAVVVAAFLAKGGGAGPHSEEGAGGRSRMLGWLTTQAEKLAHGSSPCFAAAMGVGLAIPSVDYLALLFLIATSGVQLQVQITALLTFLTMANAVLLVPIISYLLAPRRTRSALERLRSWVLARRRRDYAILLTIAGCLMIAVGIRGLR